MNKVIPLVIAIVVIGAGYLLFTNSSSPPLPAPATNTNATQESPSVSFENPKKSAHYESNTPAHGAILPGVPINVVIDFNFDLVKPSEIKILKDPSRHSAELSRSPGSGQVDFGVGETIIDSNKLAMRRDMIHDAPNGLYIVEYKACWPDGSCHEGNFQFAIDRSQGSSFEDRTKQSELTIRMSDIKFIPMNIKISKGTKVTWVNDDQVEHYVNTDAHPAHTYYPDQNSKALKKGDSYSITFTTPGIYPYHCSAHADSMIGSLLVE